MPKIVYPQRPSAVIGLTIYPNGQERSLCHAAPYLNVKIRDLMESLRQEIDHLPGLIVLQQAVKAIHKPAEAPIPADEASDHMKLNLHEATRIQKRCQEPLVFVVTVDHEGIVAAGFALADSYATEAVKYATQEVAVALTTNPAIATLQSEIKHTGQIVN